MFQLDKVWGRWTLSFQKNGQRFSLKIFRSRFLFGVVAAEQKTTLERLYEPYDYKYGGQIASRPEKETIWVYAYPDEYVNEFRLLLNRWDALKAVVDPQA